MFKQTGRTGLIDESSRSSANFDGEIGLENFPKKASNIDTDRLLRVRPSSSVVAEIDPNHNSPARTPQIRPAVEDIGLPPLNFRVRGKRLQEIVDYYLPIVHNLEITISAENQEYAKLFVKWYQLLKANNLSKEENISKRILQKLLIDRLKDEKNKALKMQANEEKEALEMHVREKADIWQNKTMLLKVKIDQQFINFHKFYEGKFSRYNQQYLEGLLVDLRENHEQSTNFFKEINSYIKKYRKEWKTTDYAEEIEELRSHLLQTAYNQEAIIYEFHRVYDFEVDTTPSFQPSHTLENTSWPRAPMSTTHPIKWFASEPKKKVQNVEAKEVDYVKLFTML